MLFWQKISDFAAVFSFMFFLSKTEVINSSKKHFRSFTAILTTLGGVMWPGVEPQRGIYNETYLRIVKDIVEEAATYGIYVLADMHQEPIQWMYRWYLGACLNLGNLWIFMTGSFVNLHDPLLITVFWDPTDISDISFPHFHGPHACGRICWVNASAVREFLYGQLNP